MTLVHNGGTHKGNRQLSSPKREKREADKRKSVNSLKDMLRSWQPAAALDEFDCDTSSILPARKADDLPASSRNEEAREDENPDVDIELQKEIRGENSVSNLYCSVKSDRVGLTSACMHTAMEKRLELKLKVFLKDAVGDESCRDARVADKTHVNIMKNNPSKPRQARPRSCWSQKLANASRKSVLIP